MSNSRKLAVTALMKVDSDTAYSNITLNNTFRDSDATNEEKSLATAIFYGVLDRRITLDYVLSSFMKTPLKKVAPYTLQVLRSGLYQIMYMDKIPESAAVNESVKLVKKSKESHNAGFVNGVLRNAARSGKLLPEGDSVKDLSIRYSCPEWIVYSFISDYGHENAEQLLRESLKPAPLIIRVNTILTDKETVEEELAKENVLFEESEFENALVITKGIDISKNELYKKGFFYVQDLASQKVVSILNPKPGDRVLDVCAAPGGKSFTLAQIMHNQGQIIACDLYGHRVSLISDSAKRLGIDIVKPLVSDATVYNENLGKFDFIVCDVPCSGLGVLRRKPDIKYKDSFDFSELEEIQYDILCNSKNYLKPGGIILYSTCTLRKNENENIVSRFINENPDFDKRYEHTYMPHIDRTDGFYCALIKNK